MDGFDTSELEKYEKELLALATVEMPKESKKFLKKSTGKLSTINKSVFKSSGAALGDGSGTTEQEMLKAFKAGKVYKYNGDLTCRAYSSHPLTHLLDIGYIHKGGKDKKGIETWIPGYHFMDTAKNSYENPYYGEVQKFIDDMLNKGLG